jgi:prophage DNA circulation protein
MAWRDQLQKAQFRGLPFLYEQAEADGGQNTVTHVFPLRDKPLVEFLGRKPRKRTLRCYLFGDTIPGKTHIEAGEAFLEAVETPGAGKLVHPYSGEMRVSVINFSGPNLSTKEGGMARFTLEIIEADDQVAIKASQSTTADVLSKADAANQAIQNSFGSKFSVINKIAFVADEAAKVVNGASDALATATSLVTGPAAAVSGLVSSLQGFAGNVDALILSPVTLATELTGIVGQLALAAAGPAAALGILEAYFGFGTDADPDTELDAVPQTTPNRVTQAANQQAVVDLVQRAATIEAVRQSALMTFDSAQQAAAVRQRLQDQLDALVETADDDAFPALAALRTAMQKDITSRSADLAQVITYESKVAMPASLIAWKLYGDPSRGDEIVARNALPMPAFVPAGEKLEVLSADA